MVISQCKINLCRCFDQIVLVQNVFAGLPSLIVLPFLSYYFIDNHSSRVVTLYNIPLFLLLMIDIDECSSSSTNNCASPAYCVNTFGGYTCACPSGYSLNSDSTSCSGNLLLVHVYIVMCQFSYANSPLVYCVSIRYQ